MHHIQHLVHLYRIAILAAALALLAVLLHLGHHLLGAVFRGRRGVGQLGHGPDNSDKDRQKKSNGVS